jgi:K+-transporting ATPase ATPase C chain
MLQNLSKSLTLLMSLVIIVCGIYPCALWVIGQTLFPFQANGSMLQDSNGKMVGSKLIAQPFTKDEYFQPRPSAASYDASASASSALAGSNYALRDRVARSLGPIAKFQNGDQVAPAVEKWFQQNNFQSKANIVGTWATLHNSLAQAWVNADATHSAYVDDWMKSHPDLVTQYKKDNPDNSAPKAADLAVVFFQSFSQENPGKFPLLGSVPGGTTGKAVIEAGNSGSDIQTTFFDMWRQDNPDAALQEVPSDFVTTSASGLDPHITLQNAEFQLERVVTKWSTGLKRNPADIRSEIQQILEKYTAAPFGGLAGEKFVNVLEVNLALLKQYGSPQ